MKAATRGDGNGWMIAVGVAMLVVLTAGIVGLVARAQDIDRHGAPPPAKEQGDTAPDAAPDSSTADSTTADSTTPGSTTPGSTTPGTTPAAIANWRFPDAATTGVPVGTVLRPVIDAAETWLLDHDLDSVSFEGTIVLGAPNITIRNSRITGTLETPAIWNRDGMTGITISDVEVRCAANAGSPPSAAAVSGANLTVVRADISGCADGIQAGAATTIADSYIHDLGFFEGTHNDGIQIGDGDGIVITGNRIVQLDNGRYQANAAVFVQDTYGPVSRVQIVGNKVDGFGFSLQLAGRRISSSEIVGNVVGRGHLFGPVLVNDGAEVTGQQNRVAGNVRPDGTPIG